MELPLRGPMACLRCAAQEQSSDQVIRDLTARPTERASMLQCLLETTFRRRGLTNNSIRRKLTVTRALFAYLKQLRLHWFESRTWRLRAGAASTQGRQDGWVSDRRIAAGCWMRHPQTAQSGFAIGAARSARLHRMPGRGVDQAQDWELQEGWNAQDPLRSWARAESGRSHYIRKPRSDSPRGFKCWGRRDILRGRYSGR